MMNPRSFTSHVHPDQLTGPLYSLRVDSGNRLLTLDKIDNSLPIPFLYFTTVDG